MPISMENFEHSVNSSRPSCLGRYSMISNSTSLGRLTRSRIVAAVLEDLNMEDALRGGFCE